MKYGQSTTVIPPFDDPFMVHMGQRAACVPRGMYHLLYDGDWRCEYVSEGCLELLGCSQTDFLHTLLYSAAFAISGGPAERVDQVLRRLAGGSASCDFLSVPRRGGSPQRFVSHTLSASSGGGGALRVYGQMVDVTALYEKDERYRILDEEYHASLRMSGRTIYRYLVEGRRAFIPPETAHRVGIPEVIENLPEWNVSCGRIAPESVTAWYGIFDAIHRGEESGRAEVLFRLRGGELLRRCRVEFASITGNDGSPLSAIISHTDITDEYERDRTQALDREGLLQIAQLSFPEILSVNLTRGTYRMIQCFGDTTLGTPQEGPLDRMLGLRLPNVAPEEQRAFQDAFCQQGLMEAIRQGKETVQLTYRRIGQDGVWHWMETTAIRQANPYDDDILILAVSRNVDKQKHEEDMLRLALADTSGRLEDWLYYNSLSKRSYPGLVYTGYDDGRESPYVIGSLAQALGCLPRELALGVSPRIHPEDRDALPLARAQAEEAGVESFHAEYRVCPDAGTAAWISNRAVRFADRDGHGGYIHFLTDTTHEHSLAEQVRAHMEEKLAETEKIFNVVAQHSDRTLYAYDLQKRTTRPWDTENQKKDLLAHVYEGVYSDDALDLNQYVLPDCVGDVKKFFANIHGGKPSGEINVHVMLLDGQRRWFHFKYSSLFQGGRPATALISIADVTDRHEQELSHLRMILSIGSGTENHLSYMEADLTADLVEKHTGVHLRGDPSAEGERYSVFHERYALGLSEADQARAYELYARESLLAAYGRGVQHLEDVWPAESAQGRLWALVKVELMADPFTGHIKMFAVMTDVTAEQEERFAVSRRADFDAMTGLLRRDTGEERIRQHLALDGEEGGILIVLDLDDLKSINDTLGHESGDQAIRGIADTLKGHFRRDDILIRSGGDEFIAYLPGAGKSVSAVMLSMAALLRKLSSFAIGEEGERYIHCSAGCAVAQPGADTFEALFRRADLALYHVKRHGKNSFAFYEPEMLREDYRFKVTQAAPVMSGVAKGDELRHLLEVVASYFPGVILLNLTRNFFRTLSMGSNVEAPPPPDTIEAFWRDALPGVHPDDREDTLAALSRDSLLSLYAQGKHSTRHYYRNFEAAGYVRAQVVANLFTTGTGDICAFLFFRRDIAPEQELEVLRLRKMLELSAAAGFEYICQINVRSGSYCVYSSDGWNSHGVPEFADFDTATRHIRDTQIPPEGREAYYAAASLEQVLLHMRRPEDRYCYRYTLLDGTVREAAFAWYEDSRSELLMAVRRAADI